MASKQSLLATVRFITLASLAAFGAYFCMYAFRKPFTVATYEGIKFLGVDYKVVLVVAQVLGYALSKFIGIRRIAELVPQQRFAFLLTLIAIAELSLLLFAWVKAPYNFIFMFLNGIPLGLVWGIVFSYLEGRKFTDFLGVALCASFIVSSGVVKSVGLYVMQAWGVSQWAMPAVTGALFLVPLIFFGWLLERIPSPTPDDHALRTIRLPMSRQDRKQLLSRFWLPIVVVILFYTFLTAFRDFRDNFARELWDSIGYSGDVAVYTQSELIVAIVVLLMLGAVVFVKNNFRALQTYHALMFIGLAVLLLSTLLFQQGLMAPFPWMVATGFGMYVCYVPFNSLFFDRYIAAFRIRGNAGFLIYLADAFGYAGSVLALLYKSFGQGAISWLNFFIYGTYVLVLVGAGTLAISFFRLRGLHRASAQLQLSNHE